MVKHEIKNTHFSPLRPFFDKYGFGEKDCYEIGQIYNLLSEEKQKNIIANFDDIAKKIEKIGYDIHIEQGILIGSALSQIELAIQKAKLQKGL